MKKITSVLALALALVMCVGLLAACTGGDKETTGTTQKPGTTTGANKDEDKNTKPQETKPEETEPETDETQPEEDETPEQDTESQPEGGETEEDTTPEDDKAEDSSASK